VGPPVPIVKNSADFATPVKDKDAANISKALDRDVIIFFIFPPLYRYFYIIILTVIV
jgi:hypothetical protein